MLATYAHIYICNAGHYDVYYVNVQCINKETVLGKAAMYLNARIPELTEVSVSSPEELNDFEDVLDEFTGAVIDRLVNYMLILCKGNVIAR